MGRTPRSRRTRWLVVGTAALAAAAAALWTAPRWLVPRLAARSPRCLYAVATDDRVVALTLDDGPDAAHTPAILALLREHGARATFFFISGRVPGREALAARAVAEGHEIGNHLTRDEPSIRLPPAEFAAALGEAGRVLGRFGPVRWFRPGSAWYDSAMLDAAERAGYRCALGSVYPYDAHLPSARLAAAYVLAHARPGAVVVLHEGRDRGRRTLAVLRRVLPALRARGYRVTTLTELAARTTPRDGARAPILHGDPDVRRPPHHERRGGPAAVPRRRPLPHSFAMPPLTPSDAAVVLRQAVAALSGRLSSDFGDLVPEASAERTAALAAKLEAGGAGADANDVVTLDSWIRLADSAVLHDDAEEARGRADLAVRLRAVRAVLTPDAGPLTEDPRSA